MESTETGGPAGRGLRVGGPVPRLPGAVGSVQRDVEPVRSMPRRTEDAGPVPSRPEPGGPASRGRASVGAVPTAEIDGVARPLGARVSTPGAERTSRGAWVARSARNVLLVLACLTSTMLCTGLEMQAAADRAGVPVERIDIPTAGWLALGAGVVNVVLLTWRHRAPKVMFASIAAVTLVLPTDGAAMLVALGSTAPRSSGRSRWWGGAAAGAAVAASLVRDAARPGDGSWQSWFTDGARVPGVVSVLVGVALVAFVGAVARRRAARRATAHDSRSATGSARGVSDPRGRTVPSPAPHASGSRSRDVTTSGPAPSRPSPSSSGLSSPSGLPGSSGSAVPSRTAEAGATERTPGADDIARELHDVLGSRLAQLSLHAGALELVAGDEQTRASARVMRETAGDAVDELQGMLSRLRERAHRSSPGGVGSGVGAGAEATPASGASAAGERGVTPGARSGVASRGARSGAATWDGRAGGGPRWLGRILTLVREASLTGVNVETTIGPGALPDVSGGRAEVLCSVVREALTNAERYAPEGAVLVEVVVTDRTSGAGPMAPGDVEAVPADGSATSGPASLGRSGRGGPLLVLGIVNRLPSAYQDRVVTVRGSTGSGLAGLAQRVAASGGTFRSGFDPRGRFGVHASWSLPESAVDRWGSVMS